MNVQIVQKLGDWFDQPRDCQLLKKGTCLDIMS